MSQQSNKMRASVTSLRLADEPLPVVITDEQIDTAPCEYQPLGVDEKEEKEEPQGDPSY